MMERALSEGGIATKVRPMEHALGPALYTIIFQRWTLGTVLGSQFLANLLLMWERLGYFKPRHLSMCKKRLLLLTAYAKSDGVPDGEAKERKTGWYKIADHAEMGVLPKQVAVSFLSKKEEGQRTLSGPDWLPEPSLLNTKEQAGATP